MKKRIFAILTAAAMILVLLPATMFAATVSVGTEAQLASAITAAAPGDTIQLTADIIATATITITKDVTLDLNGHNLQVPGAGSKNITVTGGSLTITGSGRIYEKEDNRWLGAIIVKGGTAVTIGEDVILEGWCGVMADKNGTPYTPYSTIITIRGIIHAFNDKGGGSGGGLYINGTVNNTTTYPTFNVEGTAVITSTGAGIYAAGYAQWNIKPGCTITGVESGIAIKAGTLNISGGTISATGVATLPPAGWSDGVNASGCAIQIESNDSYAGNIIINITGGTISSANGYALYEYLDTVTTDDPDPTPTTISLVNRISVSGGTLTSQSSLSKMMFSAELTAKGVVTTDGTEVTANADVTYTVIIPASVDFGTIYKSMGTQTKPFAVAVESALVEASSTIKVTNTTADMNMYDRNGASAPTGNKLAFTLAQTGGIFSFAAADLADGTQTITSSVSCQPLLLTAAGSYKGYMTFSVDYTVS